MIVSEITVSEKNKWDLDLLEQLTRQGWEVSVATTQPGEHSWLPRFAQYTPDIFILPHFLRPLDSPRFLRYLIQSRRSDVVLISQSELGYLLLPYLRAHCPEATFVDFCHTGTSWRKNDGSPGTAVGAPGLLDLNLVSSCFRQEHVGEQVIALLQEARRLHKIRPHRVPNLEMGQADMAQAVEHAQLVEETDDWGGEHPRQKSAKLLFPVHTPPRGQWCLSLYFALRRQLLPYYRLGLNKNMRWLLSLKNVVKRVLLGEVWS
jgi:hypothetical protein